MWVALERLLHQQRQRTEPFPHVGVAGRQPDPHAARNRDHRQRPPAVRAAITFANVVASGAPSTVTRTCLPKQMAIEAGGATGGVADEKAKAPVSDVLVGSASI